MIKGADHSRRRREGQWRSKGASGGRLSWAQALRANQQIFSQLKSHFQVEI